MYRFDGSLRRITMDAIERVEVAMRATINNHMSFKYGPDWIADASIFSMSYSHSGLLRPLRDQLSREQNKLGREIDRIKKSVQPDRVQKQRIENRMRDNYFRFYGSTYARPELPPAWAVLEELSLGTVSTLFNAIGKSVDKKIIAVRFSLPFEVLASWLHTLTSFETVAPTIHVFGTESFQFGLPCQKDGTLQMRLPTSLNPSSGCISY
nr:Abi family protein [Pseudomonas viridiflava]